MLFGHSMHWSFVPEWAEHYVDYNLLKCFIKLSKLAEVYQCLDTAISSLDAFVQLHTVANAGLDAGKLQWFREINTRAVTRILAKLERRGQAEKPTYRSLQSRWQKVQLTWQAQPTLTADAGADLATNASTTTLSPLHLAVIRQDVQAVAELLDLSSADMREIAGDVLFIALRLQNDDMIRHLLRNGALLSRRSGRGEIALHVAVQGRRVDYVDLIIQTMGKEGASLDVPDNSRAWTPLFFACADGNLDIVKLLIKAGSSQKHQDRLGWTAKEVAAYRGHLAVADLFKSSDVDFDAGGPAASRSIDKHRASAIHCGHDLIAIMATLGTTRSDTPVSGIDLSFCSSSFTPGKYDTTSFLLEVSVSGVSERRRIPLPILDDQINDPFIFIVPDSAELCLVFDVIRTTGVPEHEAMTASGTALLTRDYRQFGINRQSLVREQTVTILEKDTMRMAGTVTFTPLIVRPFPHLKSPRSIDLSRTPSSPPLLVGHRGAGQNVTAQRHLQIGENTVGSFLSAANLGASCVEFDIQVTRDLQPVAFHDFSLSESGTDVALHDVTLDQFVHASNIQSPHGNPLSMIGIAHTRQEAGRPRSRSLGGQFEAGAIQIKERIKHTVDFKAKGFKPNTRGDFIQDSFATLQEILLRLPPDIGCDLEIKYPRLHEAVDAGVAPVAIELNVFVDVVLEHLDRHAGDRQIMLSSFTPEICILLAIKQKAYPVFFITNAGKLPMSDMEVRAASLQGAVHFAERWGLAGVVFACETLLLCPRLVGLVKERGLVCGTYGTLNSDPKSIELQAEAGVDILVADRVKLVARSLADKYSNTRALA